MVCFPEDILEGSSEYYGYLNESNSPGISLTILSTLLAAHNLYPSVQSFTTPFFQMSYYQPETGLYTQGRDDIYFVISAVLAFTAVRAIFIEWILRPLAKATGLKKKASLRFAEQAWLIVYDSTYWSYGIVSTFYGGAS